MDKDDVRKNFPTVVAFADQLRATFGDGVKLVYASENGVEIGKRAEEDPERVYVFGDRSIRDHIANAADDELSHQARNSRNASKLSDEG